MQTEQQVVFVTMLGFLGILLTREDVCLATAKENTFTGALVTD